ncbi:MULTISPECIES: sulfur carrier protein ThiS [Saccharibacillus]|uniref:Sulfur carrier protein ThiS n=1 Tax=Saccharibacillus brassicae TaxID=2583377 RepID=A0A4Y6UVL9_SACBS|nr:MULTISPECIES: sulfur carrier protein ThiS [Saccharibacillus]MWJ30150.1 sulfur carrier protein ThiS [Saccharibacillus sp. WB 17]QDH21174.1 sulfur carrier protein ThiS [Saccharibacillus brassicae]
MVELIINGSRQELEAATLADVVERLGLTGRPIVAEVDGEVRTSEQWASTPVTPGMKIELVHFVGGG